MTSQKTKDPEHCAALIREQDHDRWLTILFASPDDRDALAALYAFNYEVAKTRETVSEPMIGEIRLQWWRETIDGLYRGTVRRHPVAEALAPAIEKRNLPQAEFETLIDGRLSDIYDQSHKRFDDLLDYADKTGGALSGLAVRICGADTDDVLNAARLVGRAWALMGLLRALGFQAAMRRTMLPDDDLKAAGISKETLFKGEFSPELLPIVHKLVETIRMALADARRSHDHIPARQRNPFLLATLTDSYLRRLEKAGGNPLETDFSRGAASRQLRLLWGALRGRF